MYDTNHQVTKTLTCNCTTTIDKSYKVLEQEASIEHYFWNASITQGYQLTRPRWQLTMYVWYTGCAPANTWSGKSSWW